MDITLPVANAGVAQTVNENDLVTLLGTDSDVGGFAPYARLWHLVSTTNTQTVADVTGNTLIFTPNDNGVYVFSYSVTDVAGNTGTNTVQVTVNNIAPTATFNNSGPINEGSGGTVFFSSSYDPSPVDAASLHYAYDFNNDDVFEIGSGAYAGSGTSATAAIPSSYLVNGPSDFVVHGRILDKDGGFTDYTVPVHVNDVPPTIALSGASTFNEGAVYTLNLGAIYDPGINDVVSQWIVFWGDGLFDAYAIGGPKTHTYDDNALVIDKIRVTLVDQDGGQQNAGVLDRTVLNVAPTAITLNGGAVNEGSDGLVLFVGQNDVSRADALAGFRYAYDFNNDGNFEVVDSTSDSVTVPGTYLNDSPSKTIRMAIRDKDGNFGVPGSYREYFSTITVNNIAPTVNPIANATAFIGETFTQSVTFNDPGVLDVHTVTVDWKDGTPQSFPLPVGAQSFNISHLFTTTVPHTYNGVTVTVDDGDGGVNSKSFDVAVNLDTFRVTNFTPTAGGFDVQFNRPANLLKLNLYEGYSNSGDLPDITVVGNTVGAVKGSMVWNSATNTMSFVKTGGVLAADTYTVRLVSGAQAWQDASGLLDGDGNYVPGDDYVASFTVSASNARIVSMPDFARGAGQDVNLPATGTDLPIRIDNAASVKAVDLWVQYDPALLSIASVSRGSLPSDWRYYPQLG